MKSLKYMAIMALCLMMQSCFEDDADKIFRATLVEFDETSFAQDPATFSQEVREDSRKVSAQVNLVGAHSDTDLVLNFSIDPASTAVDGVNYSLDATTYTIPSNSSVGYITVNILDSSMDETSDPVTLILVLEGNGEINASENYRRFTMEITGT